jgi:uncharacterized membrane protein YphA (DoxX/SURF4 family)
MATRIPASQRTREELTALVSAAPIRCGAAVSLMAQTAYWMGTGAAARTESAFFYGHRAMMGGMLYVTAFGASLYSLDALFGWWTPGCGWTIRRRPRTSLQ